MQYNDQGEELPDPTPLELPIGFTRPPTLDELVARLVIDPAVQRELQKVDIETEEEANDFTIDDELPDPTSPYQSEDQTVTDADEIRNGFRVRANLQALVEKARQEAAAAKATSVVKKPEEDKNAQSGTVQ